MAKNWSRIRETWCAHTDYYNADLKKSIYEERGGKIRCTVCSEVCKDPPKTEKYACGTAEPPNRKDMNPHMKETAHKDALNIILGLKAKPKAGSSSSYNSKETETAMTPSQKKSEF
jgi:hypothetical protein